MSARPTLLTLVIVITVVRSASAQNYSFDARRIALGGIGDNENVAAKLVEEQRRYRKIVLPFGLFQVLRDRNIFDPDHDDFDPVRAMEYAASPIHFTFGRDEGASGQAFVNDIVNAELNRDLNAYRGFRPASELVAEGLASPNWGKTFRTRAGDGMFQGIYVGAGPYLAVHTDAHIDPELVDVLGSSTNTYVRNTTFDIANATTDQLALAITGGYRARLPFAGRTISSSNRDGTYIAANYHYLYGFHVDDFDLNVRFDTDSNGLVTLRPTTTPVVIERLTASKGRGFALDFGVAFVVDRWDFGVGASGVANRIEWKELERERFVLQSLFDGGDFIEQELAVPSETLQIELPVNYSSNVGYHADRWSALAEYAHGFQGNNVHGGIEYRLGAVELRGGGRYSRDRWYPSGGAGFNLSPEVGIDLAVFGTSTNIERRRHTALAMSMRFNQN